MGNQGPAQAHRRDLAIPAALSLIAAVAFLVTKLASEIAEGETEAFDRAALAWIRLHAGGWPGLHAFMLDVTALGDTIVLAVVVLLVAGYLATIRRPGTAALLVAETALGTSLASLLRPWFGRMRPDVVPHWTDAAGLSFPSGHAANSAVVYLTLAVVAGRVAPDRAARTYLVGSAVALVVAIGASRLYLGVHWPTDVLAGWALGGGWAVLCRLVLPAARPPAASRSATPKARTVRAGTRAALRPAQWIGLSPSTSAADLLNAASPPSGRPDVRVPGVPIRSATDQARTGSGSCSPSGTSAARARRAASTACR